MDSVEEELWNIFTHYSLHGNPRDPSKLQCTQFLKLCRDTMVMDHTMTDRPLAQADIQLICTAELRNKSGSLNKSLSGGPQTQQFSDRLDYAQYLSCLMRVAQKCYPRCGSSEDAMQQLLMDNILPLAARRKPVIVHSFMTQPSIDVLFHYYEDALLEIYKFYSACSDQKNRNMVQKNSTIKTFDDYKSNKDNDNNLNETNTNNNSTLNKSMKNMNKGTQMLYSDFLRFASDFGLSNSMNLTALDLGDIYLTVISQSNFNATLRSITFKEFWETLVRCAMTAFRINKDISTEDKLKGMFLYIWRHIQETMADQLNGKDMIEKSIFQHGKGGLMRGSKILNDKFISAWNKDGFKDYLQEENNNKLYNNKSPNKLDDTNTSGTTLLKLMTTNDISNQNNNEEDISDDKQKKISNNSVHVIIEDDDNVGDERITAIQLRRLLQAKPDLASLLHQCIVEEGLLHLSKNDNLQEDEDESY